MPTITGTSGFARILRISPRLPFSPSTTSVDRNAEACPTYPSFVLTVSEDLRFSQGKRLFECIVKRIRYSRLLSWVVTRSPDHLFASLEKNKLGNAFLSWTWSNLLFSKSF